MMPDDTLLEKVSNVFCPTGSGGGTDPTCGKQGGGGVPHETRVQAALSVMKTSKSITGYGEHKETRYEVSLKGKPAGTIVDRKVQIGQASGGGYDRVVISKDRDGVGIGSHKSVNDAKRAMALHYVNKRIAKEQTSNVFCPTGEGGGRNPTCSPGGSHHTGRSKTPLSRSQVSKMTPTELKKAATPIPDKVQMHGMTKSEKMLSVKVDGVDVVFTGKTSKAAHETLAASRELHPKLWQQNKSIVFSSSKDALDSEKNDALGIPGFTSIASGGDGHIVIYSGRSMGSDSLAHESAHNLAQNTWGKANPDVFDKKYNFTADRKVKMDGMRQRVTNAVTEYGKNSPAEDFAEFVTAYTVLKSGKSEYRGATMKTLNKRPKSLAAVKKLLGD